MGNTAVFLVGDGGATALVRSSAVIIDFGARRRQDAYHLEDFRLPGRGLTVVAVAAALVVPTTTVVVLAQILPGA